VRFDGFVRIAFDGVDIILRTVRFVPAIIGGVIIVIFEADGPAAVGALMLFDRYEFLIINQ